jgi:hypothetical protein
MSRVVAEGVAEAIATTEVVVGLTGAAVVEASTEAVEAEAVSIEGIIDTESVCYLTSSFIFLEYIFNPII